MKYRREELTSYWSTIHDLELGNRFALIILVRWRAGRLPPDDGKFHMLDLDTDKEEVDLANDDVLEVIPSRVRTGQRGQMK